MATSYLATFLVNTYDVLLYEDSQRILLIPVRVCLHAKRKQRMICSVNVILQGMKPDRASRDFIAKAKIYCRTSDPVVKYRVPFDPVYEVLRPMLHTRFRVRLPEGVTRSHSSLIILAQALCQPVMATISL